MSQNPPGFLRKSLFVLLLTLALFIVAEGAVRISNMVERRSEVPYRTGMAFVPAPYTVHRNEPFFSNPTLHTNSLGFRGSEFSAEPASGTFRIVMMGGSALFGYGASADDATIPAQTQRLLQEHFPEKKIEVINAGQGSFNSTQELVLYETVIADLKPDVVVVMNGYNDFYHGLLINRTPGQPAMWRDLEPSLRSVMSPQLSWTDIRRPVAKIAAKSALAHWLLERFVQLRDPRLPGDVADDGAPPNDALVDIYLRNMRHLAALTAADGVPLVVALQPLVTDRIGVEGAEWEMTYLSGKKKVLSQVSAYEDSVESALRVWPAEQTITMVDVRHHVGTASGSLFIDPVHLNDLGNRIMAEVFAEALAGCIQ